jgi:hypothetical protein
MILADLEPSMTTRRTDLLDVTGTLLTLGIWVSALAMLATFALLVSGHTSVTPAEIPPALGPEQQILAARIHQAAQLLCGVLALRVLWLLRAMVASARNGDPFVPENGARLRQIGWLILTANVVLFAASFALPPALREHSDSYPGVFTALLIFVLARIFDTGARMRTEIQETV